MTRVDVADQSPIISFFAMLMEHEPTRFLRQRFIDTEHDRSFQQLMSVRILRHGTNAVSICCPACDAVHSVRVEFIGEGSYRAYCPDVGYFKVDSGLLRVFEPDLDVIARKMARGLGIPARVQTREIVPGLLYDLGKRKFGPYTTRICFARLLGRKEEFERTSTALVQTSDRSPVLILSTTPREQIVGTPPARHAILSLPDAAEFDGDAISFEEGAFMVKLRGEDAAFRKGGIGYVFSPGFRSAVVGDQEYQFTKKQAEVVEILFEAFASGLRKMHQDEVMGRVDSSQRIGQLFQGNPAYGTLLMGDIQGYYWLAL